TFRGGRRAHHTQVWAICLGFLGIEFDKRLSEKAAKRLCFKSSFAMTNQRPREVIYEASAGVKNKKSKEVL
ncbi:MAG TPA: hypothetical protein VE176_08745, partial [Candidatus Limnocylindrales bacterium]|nr:hypothetical protein [Candidatus Limnocylindrales bacterium]